MFICFDRTSMLSETKQDFTTIINSFFASSHSSSYSSSFPSFFFLQSLCVLSLRFKIWKCPVHLTSSTQASWPDTCCDWKASQGLCWSLGLSKETFQNVHFSAQNVAHCIFIASQGVRAYGAVAITEIPNYAELKHDAFRAGREGLSDVKWMSFRKNMKKRLVWWVWCLVVLHWIRCWPGPVGWWGPQTLGCCEQHLSWLEWDSRRQMYTGVKM